MKLQISRVDVWAAGLKDRPGALAEKLDALNQAGVNLEFLIARRTGQKTRQAVVFVTPIKGAAQVRAARKAGFEKTKALHSVRVACTDKPGLGAKLTACIADAGVNMRGMSAAAIGRRAVVHFAFDTAADAAKAQRRLKLL